MKERRKSAKNWRIALIYYLIGGFSMVLTVLIGRKVGNIKMSIKLLLFLILPAVVVILVGNWWSKKVKGSPLFRKLDRVLVVIVLLVVTVLIWFLSYSVFLSEPSYQKAKDARVVSAIMQTKTVITYVGINDGNYDNFNCEHEEMMLLCREIDMNHGEEDDKEPIVTHDAVNNSQGVCIYSPLNKKGSYWYCADSEGNAGYTSMDPGSKGYCVEGESAKCPPVSKRMP